MLIIFITHALPLIQCWVHYRILISNRKNHVAVCRIMNELRLASHTRYKFLRYFRMLRWRNFSCPWPWFLLGRRHIFGLMQSRWSHLKFLNSGRLLISARRLSMILLWTTWHKLPACPTSSLWAAWLRGSSFFYPRRNFLRFILWEQFLMFDVLKVKSQMFPIVRKSLLKTPNIHITWFDVGSLCLFLNLFGAHYIWNLTDRHEWIRSTVLFSFLVLMSQFLVNLNFLMSRRIIIIVLLMANLFIIFDDNLIFMASLKSFIHFICN